MSLLAAVEQGRWNEIRRLLEKSHNCARQMDPISFEDDQVTILHLLCLAQAPLSLLREVLCMQPKLVQQRTSVGGDLPLHYCVAVTCLGDISKDARAVQLLVERYPAAVCQKSGELGRYGSQVTPLDVAISFGGPPNLISFLLRNQVAIRPTLANLYNLLRHQVSSVSERVHEIQLMPAFPIVVLSLTLVSTYYLRLMNHTHQRVRGTGLWRACGTALIGYGAVKLLQSHWIGTWRDQPPDMPSKEETPEQQVPSVTIFYSSGRPIHNRASTSNSTVTGGQSREHCIVCWDHFADHVLLPCGHICLCAHCAARLHGAHNDNKLCPVGNCKVKSAYRVYRSSTPSFNEK